MLQYDHHESIIFWVVTTAHALERVVNEELAPLGMTFRQAEVLAWLALEGSLTQTELAERMRIESPTLAGIVDRMERAEWVVRTQTAEDRRKKHLTATNKVEPVWEQLVEAGQRIRARATKGFEPDKLHEIIHYLGMIQENLNSKADESSAALTDEQAEKG